MIKTNILGDTSKLEFKVKPLAKKILKCVCKELNIKSKHIASFIFVDIEKIESEAIDINNEEDKKAVDDLMKGQFELEFEMPEDEKPKEEIKKQEEEKKKKEDDGITDMWKF